MHAETPGSAEFLAGITSARTRQAYERDLDVFGEYLASIRVSLGDVQRYHLLAYAEHLDHIGYRPSTIDRRLVAVRRFLIHQRMEPGSSVTSSQSRGPMPTVGLADVQRLIAAVDEPSLVLEGIAILLSVSRCARVDDLVAIPASDLSKSFELSIGSDVHQLPKTLRIPLRELERQAAGGLLFGGLARQTITRRVRRHGERLGIAACTPQMLARSSDRVVWEAAPTSLDTTTEWTPSRRLAVIVDAIQGAE